MSDEMHVMWSGRQSSERLGGKDFMRRAGRKTSEEAKVRKLRLRFASCPSWKASHDQETAEESRGSRQTVFAFPLTVTRQPPGQRGGSRSNSRRQRVYREDKPSTCHRLVGGPFETIRLVFSPSVFLPCCCTVYV
jgi:hypothetical protein